MSEVKRFFAENITPNGEYELCGEEFEHAKNVLRLNKGDKAILLDNTGNEYAAVVADVKKKSLLFQVGEGKRGEREAKTEIALAFGYLKNADKNEFIVQKAVELGVNKIFVFSSTYSSAYMNENKLERLNKVSREAAKQCLRSVAPVVTYFSSLDGAIEALSEYENKLFACEFAERSERRLSSLRGACVIVVGSEGGFSEEEANKAKTLGFTHISLGRRILRAETAAVALTAVVAYSLGEWGDEA